MTRQKHRKRRVRDRAAKTGESYTAALRHVRLRQEAAAVSTTNEDSRTVDELLVECSFCKKSQKDVQKLIAGPGVYICDECVGLCNTIFEADAGDIPHASVDQVLEVLKRMDPAKKTTRSWVALCLGLGADWQQIGEVMAMSADEAEQRLGSTD